MWDARLEAIRDRKLNELIIFAAFIRTDLPRRHEFVGIIDKINQDLDLIEALAENGPIPETTPIENDVYRSRLSKLELMDEYCLDSCRKGENDFGPIICKEHASTSVTVKPRAESPAVIPEYPKPVQVTSEAEEPKMSEDTGAAEESVVESVPEQIPEEETEVAKEEVQEEPATETESDESAEESQDEEDVNIYDIVISIDDAVALKHARDMKDLKIDLFIDRELNGHFNDEACEEVITFLKTDIKLIDLILSINVNSKEDIESKIREIVDFVKSSEEPKNQKMYINSLNMDERKLEGQYNDVLKNLEKAIASRYTYLLDADEASLFFS